MTTGAKLLLSLVSASLFVGRAQNLGPSFALSAGESVKARQLAEALSSAEIARQKANAAWTSFYQTYQAAHSDLPYLRFTSDFAAAVVVRNRDTSVPQATAVPLNAEDRHKAETLYHAMLDSDQALQRARNDWQDYQYQLVADHVPSTGSGAIVTLISGKQVTLPSPWGGGIAFTPDFRLAIPR